MRQRARLRFLSQADGLLHLLPPEFPLRGRDVTKLGIPPGPDVGRLLAAVEEWWEAGDYRADRRACLARLKALAHPAGADTP